MVSWVIAGWLSGAAHGAPYYAESAAVATKADAQRLAEDLPCPGDAVKRYEDGGWRWVWRTTALDDLDATRSCLSDRPDDAAGWAVWDVATGGTVAASTRAPSPDRAPTAEGASAAPADGPTSARGAVDGGDAERWLARLARGHRGAGDVTPLDAERVVVFRFTRHVGEDGDPDARVVRHVYARRGGDRYLSVEPVSGEGTPSRAHVVGAEAWLEGDAADGEPLDAARARAQIDRFAPAAVLGLAAELHGGLPDREGWDRLRAVSVDDAQVVLADPGTREDPPLRLWIDPGSGWLQALERGPDGGAVRWVYADWRRLGDGRAIPATVEVRRGATRLDRVEIEALEVDPVLPTAWFEEAPR